MCNNLVTRWEYLQSVNESENDRPWGGLRMKVRFKHHLKQRLGVIYTMSPQKPKLFRDADVFKIYIGNVRILAAVQLHWRVLFLQKF